LAFIFGLGGGILGILFGFLALSQIRGTGQRGRGLALSGIILGFIGLAGIVTFVGVFLAPS
jgi:hypothetical protein